MARRLRAAAAPVVAAGSSPASKAGRGPWPPVGEPGAQALGPGLRQAEPEAAGAVQAHRSRYGGPQGPRGAQAQAAARDAGPYLAHHAVAGAVEDDARAKRDL